MDEPVLFSKSYQADLNGLTVIIPCHKEDPKLVTSTFCELRMLGAEVFIVDDGDTMELPDEVEKLTYRPQMGYGYAIMQGIKKSSNSIICTMDGDGEHRVEDVSKLYTVFKLINNCSMLVGRRWNKKENKIRWIGRKAINFLAVCWSRHMLPDLNSGLRIFRKDLVNGYMPILCETFSFTTSLTMCMVTDNHKVDWFPIETNPRLYGSSHVSLLKDGFITVFYIFYIGFALRTRNVRRRIRQYFKR